MRSVNVNTVELGESLDRGTIANREVTLGDQLGAVGIGASVYEVAEGKWVWPYHYHHGVEEWLYVISGAPLLREPAGKRTLAAGDVVCWPSGTEGAHSVAGPGRFVIFSAGGWPDVSICVYPDSDKVGPRAGDVRPRRIDTLNFPRTAAVDYWTGEGSGETEPVELVRPPDSGTPRPVSNVLSARPQARPGEQSAEPGPRLLQLGPALGARLMGATTYELDPGQGGPAYHYEYGAEEWLLVLAGAPTLRHPGGEDPVVPGDVVCFPEGPDGAHRLLNPSETAARYVIFSTKRRPAVVVYPDTGEIGVWPTSDGGDWIFRRSDAVDRRDGDR